MTDLLRTDHVARLLLLRIAFSSWHLLSLLLQRDTFWSHCWAWSALLGKGKDLTLRKIARLSDIGDQTEVAIIINCSTKWFSTLALSSIARNTALTVVLIDCESDDNSEAHFLRIAAQTAIDFYWLDWPLRPHGVALDQVFREIRSKNVLLVDSDIEVRSPHVISAMQTALRDNDRAFGAGFVHSPGWLDAQNHRLPPRTAYYAERMWIPLVLLNTASIRSALAAGQSFLARREYYELRSMPGLADMLRHRFRVPGLRSIRFSRSGLPIPSLPLDQQPAYIEFDTGASVYQYLLAEGSFCSVDPDLRQDVEHFHGVTRSRKLSHRVAAGLRFFSDSAWASEKKQRQAAVEAVRERYPDIWKAVASATD